MDQIFHDNDRLLTLISEYLCFTPAAIAPEDVKSLARECELPPNDAYMALLASHLGLDTSKPDDARLYRQYLPKMLHELSPGDYRSDTYMRAIPTDEGAAGQIDLVTETVQPMELFVTDDFRTDGEGRIYPQLGWFAEPFRYPAIREEGRVWMTVTPNEVNTIRPAIEKSRGKVLACGLGLGYYAFHCLLKEDVGSVTVVEQNPQIIDVFTRLILPHFPRRNDLRIVQGDAFDYVARHAPQEGFDTVFTDLWHDVADGLPMYKRMKALEYSGPDFLYWIEPTLKCYLP